VECGKLDGAAADERISTVTVYSQDPRRVVFLDGKATQAAAIMYAPTVKTLERGGGGVECGGLSEAESAACS
jgi:hypothetical protein